MDKAVNYHQGMDTDLIAPADVERETNIAIDVIRKWRSRYGWPVPASQSAGTGYSREQISQLKLISRLLDGGFRPSQIIGRSLSELQRFSEALGCTTSTDTWTPFIRESIALLQNDTILALQLHLEKALAENGLTRFVREQVAPLAIAIGEAWVKGDIEVHQEHLATSLLTQILLGQIQASPRAGSGKCVLLATPPEELHLLGLIMVQAILADAGIPHIMLGGNVPISEIAKAVERCESDILALSFSFSYPTRKIRPLLEDLRSRLPQEIEIWAGGAGLKSLVGPAISGVRSFNDLELPLSDLH